MRRAVTISMSVAALLLCAGAAGAEDFTFNVPVELHKIPAAIKSFSVQVEVHDHMPVTSGPSAGYYPGNDVRIGYASSGTITIVNGEYAGTVTVRFNALPGKKPEQAISYSAWIVLNGPPGYQGGALVAMALDGPYPYDASKPLVTDIKGTIPQPAKH